MTKKVLIIGGTGSIGHRVAEDIQAQTQANVTVAGLQSSYNQDFPFLPFDLNNFDQLKPLISNFDLVVHCAGPFHHRDGRVLKTCIEAGINYIDVSDHRSFYFQATEYHQAAQQAGVTAILHTGVFPGISNLMAKKGVEALDQVESIHLNYLVAGSGGAGLTVMQTTFLGLQSPFSAWINGKWQEIIPYSEPETVQFEQYGEAEVYWFDVAETYTLTQSFPVNTVVTKFASLPSFYNDLTSLVAHRVPHSVLKNPLVREGLSWLSLGMARVTDRVSGVGIAVAVDVTGWQGGQKQRYRLNFSHHHTAIAAGMGAGSVAQLLLNQEMIQPGVWSIEQAVTTPQFEAMMKQRGLKINLI
ncbi:saccharopine dehydrogenase family protein [Halothece sp. PCC 7418]|uniref:saccharopine dehydrogenase family protein n=1 Tax=Halothece sp. (strain PCC 7418) TaxID=65093 RepID=UPI0002D4B1AA|nr:saccharopine dehydrogenase NADP-binding domain-containing protein [Halothece sp. PCC 7418]